MTPTPAGADRALGCRGDGGAAETLQSQTLPGAALPRAGDLKSKDIPCFIVRFFLPASLA
ncbi:hypothetical protein [Polymorphobacter fuscus]|uniref:hypothetical protein n=1 Tax=Sandarakinorhabdus fusca TaxID=1439888 RepID=UPI0014303756|nr:hypothetical protein [Polymorphobacter fuscus]NJC09886.1 hypothetical protein [Polymorphobacter fuscus]